MKGYNEQHKKYKAALSKYNKDIKAYPELKARYDIWHGNEVLKTLEKKKSK